MRFRIVYDKPGRLRLRAGAYAFEREYEARIHKACLSEPCVKSVVVRSVNGGLLFEYSAKAGDFETSRKQILDFVSALNPKELPECDGETEYQLQALDDGFKASLTGMIARRYLSRWFLPLPIRTAITVVRGLRYVARGISTLMSGKLTVDVLDGAAIGASLLQKNYESAGTVMFLLGVSGLLEDYTKARTRTALTGSLAVKVDKVWVVKDGVDTLVDMKDVQVDDLVRIRSGSMIPVDGRVMEGEAGMKCYTREEVKHYLANIAQTIKPALSDENGNRVADIVIDTLDNARNSYVMFSYTYFHAPTGTTRQKDFRLVNYDDVDDRRCILPTHEGYQVLMGTLDVPLEEKQILAQRMLTLLLERGHFQQALEVARDVWMKASEYRNHIRALLDNALRSPGTVNWEQSLLPYLEAASKHIDEAQNNLQHINDVIADKRSQAKGDNRVALANTKDWAEKALRIRAVLLEEIHAAPEQFKKAQALIFRMRAPSGLPDPDCLLSGLSGEILLNFQLS